MSPQEVQGSPILQHFYVKYETILGFMANLAFYLHLKASGAESIRNHPVMDALVGYTNILKRLEEAEESSEGLIEMVQDKMSSLGITDDITVGADSETLASQSDEELTPQEDSEVESEPESESGEEESADEVSLNELRSKLKGISKPIKNNVHSDFQDSEYMDEGDAEDKSFRKRSLRHHASIINQGIIKSAQQPRFTGDTDIPYKITEKKIRPPRATDDNLEVDMDLAPEKEEAPKKKRVRMLGPEESEKRRDNWVANNPDEQELREGWKRLATVKILKNKGLAPKRKKEQRNPRVKHRKKYEKALKKLGSTKRLVKETNTAYGGETAGIKSHLSRSTRL